MKWYRRTWAKVVAVILGAAVLFMAFPVVLGLLFMWSDLVREWFK